MYPTWIISHHTFSSDPGISRSCFTKPSSSSSSKMFVARRPEPPKRLGPPAGHLSMDVSDIMDATKKTKRAMLRLNSPNFNHMCSKLCIDHVTNNIMYHYNKLVSLCKIRALQRWGVTSQELHHTSASKSKGGHCFRVQISNAFSLQNNLP